MTTADPVPGYPRPQAPPSGTGSTVLLVVGFVLIALCGTATTVAVLVSNGPSAFLAGLSLAVFPVIALVAFFLWLDRYEPEPRALLLFAFGWGAGVATLGALVLNVASSAVLTSSGREADATTAVFVAPFVEEGFKGLGLLAIVLVGRRGLDGVVDGVVYAGLIGAGFAFVENILYLGTALVEAGTVGLVVTFVLRGVVSPFAHPLFTAATGIGLAYAVRRGGLNWALVIVGYAVAVALHSGWNRSAVGDAGQFLTRFVVLAIPVFLLYLVLALAARRREKRLIRTHLAPYTNTGWLSPAEADMIGDLSARRRAIAQARQVGGPRAATAMKRFQRTTVQLAFLRNRMERRTAPLDARHREYDLLQTSMSLRGAMSSR